MTPQITVARDEASGAWRLYVFSHGKTERAGPRLFRGGEIPYLSFVHEDKSRADKDCAALQAYLNGLNTAKPSKTEARKHASDFR